jgi:hypothetical protein
MSVVSPPSQTRARCYRLVLHGILSGGARRCLCWPRLWAGIAICRGGRATRVGIRQDPRIVHGVSRFVDARGRFFLGRFLRLSRASFPVGGIRHSQRDRGDKSAERRCRRMPGRVWRLYCVVVDTCPATLLLGQDAARVHGGSETIAYLYQSK